MRTLYLRPRLVRALPRDCCVVSVSRLLKELILHACTFTGLKKSIRAQRHLIDVILDQLQRSRCFLCSFQIRPIPGHSGSPKYSLVIQATRERWRNSAKLAAPARGP